MTGVQTCALPISAGFAPEDVLEFDSEETVRGLEDALGSLGHRVGRIGRGRELARRLVGGERWDLVFNICEGLKGYAREAQVPALLEAYDIPALFSDPLTLALTLDKGWTKRIVAVAGVPTAAFAIIEKPADIAAIALPFPLFLKPVSEGSGKEIGRAHV